jgi:putative ABC transport system ATP-binding protein
MSDVLVELRAVTRSFPGPPEVEALRAVNLTIERGDYISIVGPSGSGKSTMLNILGLLDRPSVGEYRLEGVVTNALSEQARAAERAHRIGFVFQAFHLMSRRTVLENVMMPMLYNGTPRIERESLARAALERVGLAQRSSYRPDFLSGGERQRVAIARALASRPSILLADEPTGNLDQATAGEIMGLFEELNDDGLTVAVITHDVEVARRASRTVSIDRGRLSELA